MPLRPRIRILAAMLLGATALAAGAQTRWTDGILTDEAGIPLFVSDRDKPDRSDCNGACLNIWRPYLAPDDAKPAGDHGVLRRDDGRLQWTYRGRPLYRWFNDEKPMDGQGMAAGNWHVLRAAP